MPLTFADPMVYDKVGADNRISLTGLTELAPGSSVGMELHHGDGSQEEVILRHTLNATQIGWFRAGSALNVISDAG